MSIVQCIKIKYVNHLIGKNGHGKNVRSKRQHKLKARCRKEKVESGRKEKVTLYREREACS